MDAGTDNGFTFTSPNWPTVPQGIIFRITNTYPTHPAGSFHYPDLKELPTIATFSFVKVNQRLNHLESINKIGHSFNFNLCILLLCVFKTRLLLFFKLLRTFYSLLTHTAALHQIYDHAGLKYPPQI